MWWALSKRRKSQCTPGTHDRVMRFGVNDGIGDVLELFGRDVVTVFIGGEFVYCGRKCPIINFAALRENEKDLVIEYTCGQCPMLSWYT